MKLAQTEFQLYMITLHLFSHPALNGLTTGSKKSFYYLMHIALSLFFGFEAKMWLNQS